VSNPYRRFKTFAVMIQFLSPTSNSICKVPHSSISKQKPLRNGCWWQHR